MHQWHGESGHGRNELHVGRHRSKGGRGRTHLLPPRPPRVVSRRPWRPGCRFAGPIRGHLACWCWSSTAFHQLGRARQFAEARGSERWARDREGHFRVSQTQGKGADANVLVVPVGCRPELAPGRLCESESGQRAQGQKERREQVSNGCQLFALVLFFFYLEPAQWWLGE